MGAKSFEESQTTTTTISDGGRGKMVTQSADCFVQNNSAARPSASAFEEDPPRSVIGHHAGRDAFFQAAREAEGLEQAIAEIEREQEQTAKNARGRLDP